MILKTLTLTIVDNFHLWLASFQVEESLKERTLVEGYEADSAASSHIAT